MEFAKRKTNSNSLFKIVLSGLLMTAIFYGQSAVAATDYIFLSINGDTTLTTMTQGDELFWGSNCDSGATVNWEIWYDVNSNSTIDPATDIMLTSENITDGNPVTEADPILDGWAIGAPFNLGAEPGDYIFKAKDIATGLGAQKILTMVPMSSPPNQFTGNITIPGYTAPNSFLANRVIFAEPDTGDEGVFLATTDNNGFYSINIAANGTGVEFFIETSNIHDFVAPEAIFATASGVVANNDFTYIAAVDSVWGFVKDELGAAIPFEAEVAIESEDIYNYVTTENGRYVIYFSSANKGNWNIAFDSRVSPVYLTPYWFSFSHDTLTSFQHDLALTTTDTAIYAIITENGGLPFNNYRVDANSDALNSSTESVSGTGSNNVVTISVSSLDNSGWDVSINRFDDDYPIPAGLIIVNGDISSVSPGDTVSFNLVNGQLVSGTITQDPGDGPIVWDDVFASAGNESSYFDVRVNAGGTYSLYTDTGSYFMSINASGYISDPAWREIEVTGDTTGVGLGFTINETHCRVSGTLTNVSTPLDASYYQVIARTGSDGPDGYFVAAQVDSATGTYTMNLCDGDWTIFPPCCFPNVNTPDSTVVTIGESPDTVKTVDFEYSIILGIEDESLNILPDKFALNQNYPNPFNPVTTIEYSLPEGSHVAIEIYNLLGQEIRSLIDRDDPAGSYRVNWDGTDESGEQAATGIYFYRIQAGDFSDTKKMLLLK